MSFMFLLLNCAAPIDYFGNSVNLKNDRIYLIKMRKDRNDKDKYTLIFAEQRGNHSKFTNKKRVSLDVGFYYMSNAAGRLIGTLFSGLSYTYGGIEICLFVSSVMLLINRLGMRKLEEN